MTDKQVKQNNQQKVLLDFSEDIVPLSTQQQSYFVCTEDNNITQVKVYGKQSNIQTGHLFHIEGSFSAQTLQDIIASSSSCIFFVITNVCWNSQIPSIKTASTQKHLVIITNGLPTDLSNMTENQVNTLLKENDCEIVFRAPTIEINSIEEEKASIFSEKFYNYPNIKLDYIIYQPELRNKFIPNNRFNYSIYYLKNRNIIGKLIKRKLYKKAIKYVGKEYTEDYIVQQEDTIFAITFFHLAKSYYLMKQIGYLYFVYNKFEYLPNEKSKVCKANEQLH